MKKVTIEMRDEDYEFMERMASAMNKTVEEWIGFFIAQTAESTRMMQLARNIKKE